MKVVVTFDVDEKNLDDLVIMAKVYRKKDGYKEFVSLKNNLPLKPLPQKRNECYYYGELAKNKFAVGYNECLDEITGESNGK